MATPREGSGGFPELELDFKPSSRAPAAADEDDAPEQEVALELDASPSHRHVAKSPAALPIGLADTLAADAAGTELALPQIRTSAPAPVTSPMAETVAPSQPGAARLGPDAEEAAASIDTDDGARAAAAAHANVAISPDVKTLVSAGGNASRAAAEPEALAPPASAPASIARPSRPKTDVARDVAAASSRTTSGLAMIAGAVLLTLLDVAYTKATGERFPLRLVWISVPLALAGGGVVAFRYLRGHAS